MEFVEAEQACALGDPVRRRLDRVIALGLAKSGALVRIGTPAPQVKIGVNLGHKGMKMAASLGAHRRTVEEEVHQHRLSPTDRTIEIDPERRRFAAEKPKAEARLGERIQLSFQPRQGHDRLRLRRVGGDVARSQAMLISGVNGERHDGLGTSPSRTCGSRKTLCHENPRFCGGRSVETLGIVVAPPFFSREIG